jgi:FkbM family methyltransferase
VSAMRALAKGRTSLLRGAQRASQVLHKSGCSECRALGPARAAARALLAKAMGRDAEWVLAEANSHLMWIPRRSLGQYILSEYEPFTAALFRDCLRQGSTVLDIVGHSGHVFAFEPAPSNLEMLKRNVRMNGYKNVSCHAQAVSDRVGEQAFILAEASDSNSFHPHPLSPRRETLPVDCVTVDGFLAGRRVDVIKIDVEGAEISVLQGMREALEQSRGIRLFVELNPACLESSGRSGGELVGALRGAGLSIHLIDEENGGLRELDERLLDVPSGNLSYHANLYCTGTPR